MTAPQFLRVSTVALALLSGLGPPGRAPGQAPEASTRAPFPRFKVPDEWQARFWATPNARAFLKLEPKQAADLVPTQAGLRFCRCPACDAEESGDPLSWSIETPKGLTCRVCKVTLPSDKYPAPDDKKQIPEEAVEVLPGVTHKYPYHLVEASRQRFDGERLFLAARADYEAREFLSKAALYAAARAGGSADEKERRRLATLACVIVLRFAQVYPAYATHVDQPGSQAYFQQADLAPPYRLGYRTAKWDWTGSLDVPLNLVIAYALVRDGVEMDEAGQLLGETDPRTKVEKDLFLASARFVAGQPEEYTEASLRATRGILAVGRLLNHEGLLREANARLSRFAERGFYHDGFWRQGTLTAHLRVLDQLEGWIRQLLGDPVTLRDSPADPVAVAGDGWLALARGAGSAPLTDTPTADVLRASWPAPARGDAPRSPKILGGTGVARLAVGRGDGALDLELRSLGTQGPHRIQRQALRLGVGGRTVLGDLDEQLGLASGWERASVSHNTVLIDGLNHRESLARANEAAPSGDFLFFAADPDFQVVTLDDSRAYPDSATLYRQTVVASAGKSSRYAVSLFEVHGGLQHDQVFHGASGSSARWSSPAAAGPAPATLLPPGLTAVKNSYALDLRWFVQAMGEVRPVAQGTVGRPTTATLVDDQARAAGVRLHLLGETPFTAITALTPDATDGPEAAGAGTQRGTLILRRRSGDGSTLVSRFVTVFEPTGAPFPPLRRVGRVASPDGTVVILIETDEGPEYVIINSTPRTPRTVRLGDGSELTTDGLAVRLGPAGMALAGGTFAEYAGKRVSQPAANGAVNRAVRLAGAESRGWFETDTVIEDAQSLAGRVMVIRHGDGVRRAWTIQGVLNRPEATRLLVREEPGFVLDSPGDPARYYQFPGDEHPGPHSFRIGRIVR